MTDAFNLTIRHWSFSDRCFMYWCLAWLWR